MELISKFLAPKEETEILLRACQKMFPREHPRPDSDKFRIIMEDLSERWLESEDKWESRVILSVVTPHITFGEILQYIPDLNDYQFRMSRKIRHHETISDEHLDRHRERFHRDRVDLFIRFITE